MVKDKAYSIRWYGPFSSVEDVRMFEQKHVTERFQLYILNGFKPHAKLYDSYYCGQTKRCVHERLTDKEHHINDFRDIQAIWIGTITNVEASSSDLNVVEKMITAKMRAIYGDKYMLNKTNTLFPKYNAYIVNIWHKTNGERLKKYKRDSPPFDIPDVIGHEYDKTIGVHMLFGASKISWTNAE